MHDDRSDAEILLDLDGQILVIEDRGDYCVRFSVQRVAPSMEQPFGLNYSLTLHRRDGERILGIDNAHAVRTSAGPGGRKRGPSDHVHRGGAVRPYVFRDAGHLLADFWTEVDRFLTEKGVDLR